MTEKLDPAGAADADEEARASGESAGGDASGDDAEGPDGLGGRPDTPIASHEDLLAAMTWAFSGEEIDPAVLERFARHARMVLEANRVVNLTAIVDPREMAAKHYLDSWRVVRQVPLYGRSVLDVGTGAGFPGLPVAMAEPEVRVALLDSVQKRTDFLSQAVAALSVKNATVVRDRAEDHLARNSYDVVLMRAVSSVRENVRLLRKVRHSLKDLVMLKGPSWGREVRAGEREAERLGFRLDTVWEHKLPGEMGDRAILVYRAPGGHGH
jgi:16S rRNA (guanine527-N7)-methyltransferase